MITKTIFWGVTIASMILSAILIIAFDGFLMYCRGVRLFNEKYEEYDRYYRISFHVFEVTRITIMVSIIFIILLFWKGII